MGGNASSRRALSSPPNRITIFSTGKPEAGKLGERHSADEYWVSPLARTDRCLEVSHANPFVPKTSAKLGLGAHARNAIKLKETDPGVYVVMGYALLRQKKADDAGTPSSTFSNMTPTVQWRQT
jgi:hypothetical protein